MENVAANKAAARLNKIKMWTLINDNEEPQSNLDAIRKEHIERLERYRKRKDWEAWVEEDELDLEGERLLSEIKNYKDEFFYNTMF